MSEDRQLELVEVTRKKQTGNSGRTAASAAKQPGNPGSGQRHRYANVDDPYGLHRRRANGAASDGDFLRATQASSERKSGCTMKPRLVTDGAQKQAVPLWHGRISQEIPGKRTVPTPTAGAVATTTTDPSVWVRCHSRIPPRLLTAGRIRQPALLRSIRPDRISMRA